MKANYLITGATGFLGRHVLYEVLHNPTMKKSIGKIFLLTRSNSIKAPDRVKNILTHRFLPKQFVGNSDFLKNKDLIRIIEADLNISQELMENIIGQIPKNQFLTVIHCAGSVNLGISKTARSEVFIHNYQATLNLLHALQSYRIKFIFISTAFSSGLSNGILEDDYLSIPNRKYRNPYEEFKAKTEIELKAICEKSNISYQILRPSVICGRLIDPPLFYISKFDIFYAWVKFFWQINKITKIGNFRLFVKDDAVLNIVPVDLVAKTILNVSDSTITQLNIVNTRSTNARHGMEKALSIIGFDRVEFTNSMPKNLNHAEAVYYRTIGKIYNPYINFGKTEYDTTMLRSLMNGLCTHDIFNHLSDLLQFAKKYDFDEDAIN